MATRSLIKESYGPIGRTVGALATPCSLMVNERLPVGSPSGSRTIMKEPFIPGTPNIGPTFSTGKLIPLACTDNTDVGGTGGEFNPRLDVIRVMRA